MELTSRELLTHLYQTAIDAVDGRHRVYQRNQRNQRVRLLDLLLNGGFGLQVHHRRKK